ncbi:hypothetical protein DL98DRAFT_442808 [Cadophora sp. DSE1049]|nr:hypothetical protein DL98DRAFT_442808 [Cadophora sp. DSE1049]
MRIPYITNPPPTPTEEEAAILARVKARRAPRDLFTLDLALFHSPPLIDGWGSFLGAVRTQTTLPPDLREIAISRAVLFAGAWIEFDAHRRILAASPDFQSDAKAKMEVVERRGQEGGRGALSELQWAVLRYADAVTRDITVEDEVFEGLKTAGLNDRQVLEVTTTVAAYNCVSRVFVALDVGERNGTGPGPLELPTS